MFSLAPLSFGDSDALRALCGKDARAPISFS